MSKVSEAFNVIKRFHRRQAADFTRTFEPQHAKRSLAEIRAFCNQPTAMASGNPFIQAQAIGRLQVWQHIESILNYSEAQAIEVVELERQQREREARSA
jgi:hypothetical protein